MATERVLTIDALATQAAGGESALNGVSLDVPRGAGVALVGPNGGGKDLICRCLAHRTSWSSGTIALNGRPWPATPWGVARAGAIVALANERVFGSLSVRDNLLASNGWWRRSLKASAFDEVLEIFPTLRNRLAQQAGTLSGGEQQMVLLGRALLAAPKLVVLEEPWLGLAPVVINNLLDQMDRIRSLHGTSFLWTEENRDRAVARANSVYELVAGRVTSALRCGGESCPS